MTTLNNLYQEIILDHNREPRNFRTIKEARSLEGHNPLCGDHLTLYLKLADDHIVDIAFQGDGCAISVASASLMTEAMKGKTIDTASSLFEDFHKTLTIKEKAIADEAIERLGKLQSLVGVRNYPTRVKCAMLCWHALHALLHGQQQAVTTECQTE